MFLSVWRMWFVGRGISAASLSWHFVALAMWIFDDNLINCSAVECTQIKGGERLDWGDSTEQKCCLKRFSLSAAQNPQITGSQTHQCPTIRPVLHRRKSQSLSLTPSGSSGSRNQQKSQAALLIIPIQLSCSTLRRQEEAGEEAVRTSRHWDEMLY